MRNIIKITKGIKINYQHKASGTLNSLLFLIKKKKDICIYSYFMMDINKITSLNIDFGLNYEFQNLYDRKYIRVNKSLILIIQQLAKQLKNLLNKLNISQF